MNRLPIEAYATPSYRKCECCGRVQDIYYHMAVKDADTGTLLIGSFDLCERCGTELAKITKQNLHDVTGEKIVLNIEPEI